MVINIFYCPGVLDEDEGDVLVNVNILDEEKASKNKERKKAKPEYNPYEEEVDEFGSVCICILNSDIEKFADEKLLLQVSIDI